MTQVAERQGSYLAAFEALRRDPVYAQSAAVREAAFARFLDRGVPTTRDEEWRHTSVAPIAAIAFEPAGARALSPDALEPFLMDAAIPHRVTIVNGRLVPELSALASLPAGVTVAADAAAPALTADGHAFVDLNTALHPAAVVITVAPKLVVETAIHVLCIATATAAHSLVSPRLVIEVGERAQITLVEHYIGIEKGVTFTNAVTDVRVGPGAIVDHTKLQHESDSAFHLASTFVRVERSGTFTSQAITLGGRIARNDIVSTLDGEGAECTLNGLYIATGSSLVDTHTIIDHAKAHCPSHEVYKGILGGRARAVFNGKIVVRPDAQKTDAKQTNKALLLTDDAQINTKPQLEIFADDVKCTHGAAIGQLDEDAMFYLQARGIGVEAARNLLIHAFAGEVIDGVKVPAVRALALRLMEEKLSIDAQP